MLFTYETICGFSFINPCRIDHVALIARTQTTNISQLRIFSLVHARTAHDLSLYVCHLGPYHETEVT